MLTFTISCLFFSVVRALPTLLSRDVFDPPITSPSASTIWQVGQTVTVIWDITNLPPASQLTDPNGTVVLGYMASSTDSEHLMIDSPLAQDFPLSDGNVSFIVPSVVTRSDYIIALFGDSGNISPTFTIQGTDSSSSAPTTSTSVSTPLSTSSSISVPTSSSSSTLQTTAVTEAEASSSASNLASESSATNTVTSVITVSSGPASSTTAEIGSASSLSISSTSGSSASPSATEAAASSNSAWQPGVSQSQVYAFVVAGLLAACLL
ncbi:hypothetical protein LENED_001662 [Lentinula edodes]|uniref:Uncharacterized protein n=1 Tax=Lentinula edodes TaxID=5353 RepID=A0A1Q3DYU3_LENED|nr:hypothetical protein LENED_001662 [Lentinula edodes]